ncbi:MAG: L,D-transpeptidase [Casimicrobium sp.]
MTVTVADALAWLVIRLPEILKSTAHLKVHAAGLFLGICCATSLAALATASLPLTEVTHAVGSVPLARDFVRSVAPTLSVPAEESKGYAVRLQSALDSAQIQLASPQFVVLIDRSVNVQAAFIYWGSVAQGWSLVGATPVSTGLPGRYEHFTTPLGVFDHSRANPDFRAEGTKNKLGFRGYGRKGMRVYDFGWVYAPRGWGDGAMGILRLQIHATDPDRAEPRLGTAQSEGCVRISSSLNDFIDRHALLDADYERAVADGSHLWVLRADRTPTSTPGRYLVVVDSVSKERPAWSPLPSLPLLPNKR